MRKTRGLWDPRHCRRVEEERRIAAEKLFKAHAELEARVLERTAALARANEQLQRDIAERKKAEEALWTSESVLLRIFDSIPDLLSVIDRDLRIVRSNWHGGMSMCPSISATTIHIAMRHIIRDRISRGENCHTIEVFRTGKPAVMENSIRKSDSRGPCLSCL